MTTENISQINLNKVDLSNSTPIEIEHPANKEYYTLCEEGLPILREALVEYSKALEQAYKIIIRKSA